MTHQKPVTEDGGLYSQRRVSDNHGSWYSITVRVNVASNLTGCMLSYRVLRFSKFDLTDLDVFKFVLNL